MPFIEQQPFCTYKYGILTLYSTHTLSIFLNWGISPFSEHVSSLLCSPVTRSCLSVSLFLFLSVSLSTSPIHHSIAQSRSFSPLNANYSCFFSVPKKKKKHNTRENCLIYLEEWIKFINQICKRRFLSKETEKSFSFFQCEHQKCQYPAKTARLLNSFINFFFLLCVWIVWA